MTNTTADELAALRNLIAEALSLASDERVSDGARELRRKFSFAAMSRLDAKLGGYVARVRSPDEWVADQKPEDT